MMHRAVALDTLSFRWRHWGELARVDGLEVDFSE